MPETSPWGLTPQVPQVDLSKSPRRVTCKCDWPHEHCETCARVLGYTAVHMTADRTCAMYGHREGDRSVARFCSDATGRG